MTVEAISNSARAQAIWRKIQRKPSSIAFTTPRQVAADGTVTPETQLPAQIVRVVSDSRATLVEGVAGAAPQRHVVVYGVKDHPDPAVADNDIEEGYRFQWDGDTYRVTDTIPVPGGVQALARTG